MRSVAWVLFGVLGACERAEPVEVAPPPPPAPVVAPKPPPAPAISVLPPPPTVEIPRPPPPRPRPPTTNERWWAALTKVQRRDIREVCKLRQADPCLGMIPYPRAPNDEQSPGNRYAAIMRGFEGEDRDRIHSFCRRNFDTGVCDTPLVLAFDGQSIELAPAGADRFAFRAGAPAATDWPTARTPWLALDRDGDGAISSGAELFGDATPLARGGTATNGFAALSDLDANGDGVIDRHDPAFAQLVLWTDRDGDRASSPGELRPVSETVIAIPLAHTTDPRCDARGNCEGERTAMVWRDGGGAIRTGAIVDLYVVER